MKNKLEVLIVIFLFGIISSGDSAKKNDDDTDDSKDDVSEILDDAEDEDLDMPIRDDNTRLRCDKEQTKYVHEVRAATYKQFPFMAVVMSPNDEYVCSGVVVSSGLILTTGTCAWAYTKYVLLNAARDKFDDTTIKLQINRTESFPMYIGFRRQLDIGLIYTEYHNNTICSKIRISNCTYKTVYNIKGLEAVGYGLNTDTGNPKVMQYVGVELRQPVEDLESLTAYIGCVDTTDPICFKDTGSAVLLDNELLGIVYNGLANCSKEMVSKNTVNKTMADIVPSYTFKAWLEEKIKNNEEVWPNNSLPTYPDKPDAFNEKIPSIDIL